MLRIYNSLTGRKENFQAIEPGKIRIYVCGMTVYDLCHIGHARVMVVFDTVVRYLREQGFDVLYVRNITDIDDKIIKRAAENDESIDALTERFIEAMHQDAHALGVLPPDREPRATQYIPQIIDMVAALIDKQHAYVGSNNDVYFDVSSFPDYGKLSGKNIEELRAGERVEVKQEKDDPLDFVLWKAVKSGEPSWPSPWGAGRPGWHIECSAMSTHCLGNHFDIHGGGQDLQFPHHENEIAQSVCATAEGFAGIWMHNGFVRMDEKKMSKSLGNFFTVREVLKDYQAEVIRFFILSSHYRSPLNYTRDNLEKAKSALRRLYTALRDIPVGEDIELIQSYIADFNACMDDDFNTPKAIALLHELGHRLNSQGNMPPSEICALALTLKHLAGVLGLLQEDPRQFLQARTATLNDSGDEEKIQQLIAKRQDAKVAKHYAEADAIREQLATMGISLEDTPQGTIWRRN